MVSGHKKESLSGHIIQLSTWSWICNRLVRLLDRIFCGLRFILYFVLNIFKWKRQTGIWHENSRINPALSGWIITREFLVPSVQLMKRLSSSWWDIIQILCNYNIIQFFPPSMLADEWKHRKGPIQSVSPLITVLPQPRGSVQLGAMCLFIILIQTVVQNLMSSGEFS